MTSVSVAESNFVAGALQICLEGAIVLDDAIVNDRQIVPAAVMRVGVGVGRRPMRGPARVADADPALGGFLGQEGHQPIEPTGGLGQGEIRPMA